MSALGVSIACALAPLAARAAPVNATAEFWAWASVYGRSFTDGARLRVAVNAFHANKAVVADLNADDQDPAEYGHTVFGDIDPWTFARARLPMRMDAAEGRRGGDVVAAAAFAEGARAPGLERVVAVDWRAEGAVTAVKDQKSCGSCWAESAVSNIESMWYLHNRETMREPVQLSVQQVIECDAHDYACYGGYPRGAYEYAIERGGLATEAAYPYSVDGHTICLANQTYNETCGDGICDDPPLTSWCDERCSDGAAKHALVAKITSWAALPVDETQIAMHVARVGPVSVGLDASGGGVGILFPWLQFYKRGVANPGRCTSRIDHGVLVVGYGEENGAKYWIIKNSWGEKWGEAGYFRLLRGAGKCGVATMATTAIVGTARAELLLV